MCAYPISEQEFLIGALIQSFEQSLHRNSEKLFFMKLTNIFVILGDVKPSEISSSNEDIITTLESMSMSRSIRGPRPTSVPFPKTFLCDDKVQLYPLYYIASWVGHCPSHYSGSDIWVNEIENSNQFPTNSSIHWLQMDSNLKNSKLIFLLVDNFHTSVPKF